MLFKLTIYLTYAIAEIHLFTIVYELFIRVYWLLGLTV